MDIFDLKNIAPMLIKENKTPFNSPDWIYELKLDGMRCLAYLDDTEVDLRNKRGMVLLPRFPELKEIYKQVETKCILDGELVVINKNGVPDFYELQRRSILSDPFKIKQAYLNLPVSYVVYDILYYIDKEIIELPLVGRKQILSNTLKENERISISRYIEEFGTELYALIEEKKLEGVVGKNKNSKYYYGKRSKDWVKFKRIEDQEYVVCGYCLKRPMNVLILGQYSGDKLVYQGSVSFGVRLDFLKLYNCRRISYSPFNDNERNKVEGETGIIWIEPKLVCTVEYMPNLNGTLRQPVFKCIRSDVLPTDCQVKTQVVSLKEN